MMVEPAKRANEQTINMNKADKKWLTDHFGSQVAFDEPMYRHTTFGIGGPADALITVRTDDQVKDLVNWAQEKGYAYLILGAGSNLLVRDGGIRGIVLNLGNGFKSIDQRSEASPNGSVHVTAGAGVMVQQLARYALDQGLAGLNFALGIPGTVGGALRMNAGARDTCMADTTIAISFLKQKGEVVTLGKEQLCFSYRRFDLEQGSIILRGEFQLKRTDRETLQREAVRMQKKRRSSQPLAFPSAGSTFRNPAGGIYAAELIDRAGLKGLRKGGAEVSTKHANFILNKEHASASDVLVLIEQVRATVFERFEVNLEPEVMIVGRETGSKKSL